MWTKKKCSQETFKYDFIRDIFQGITEAGIQTFSLLIAIRVFHAGHNLKAFIAGAEHVGWFFTIMTVPLAELFRVRTTKLWSFYLFLTGFGLCMAAFSWNVLFYVIFIVIAKLAYRQKEPIMTAVYNRNYGPQERGKRISYCILVSSVIGIIFSKISGRFLDISIQNYRIILIVMGISAFFAGVSVLYIPCKQWFSGSGTRPFACVKYLWKDKFFGFSEIGWFFLGFGNFIGLPMRIEYLANPKFGINASNTAVAILVFAIPAVVKIATVHFWGRLFDRMNFVHLRLIFNSFWIIGWFLHFCSANLYIIGIGSIFIGMAISGGMIIWTLWLTRIAKQDKIPSYMAVHTSIIGVKGFFVPFIGYWILKHFGIFGIGTLAVVCTLVSTIIFASIRNHKRVTNGPDDDIRLN